MNKIKLWKWFRHLTSIDVNLTKNDEHQMTSKFLTLQCDELWHLLTFFDVLWRFQFLKNFEKNFLAPFDVAVNFGTVIWRQMTSNIVKTSIWRQLTAFEVKFDTYFIFWRFLTAFDAFWHFLWNLSKIYKIKKLLYNCKKFQLKKFQFFYN